jgi:hypothetical protein
MKSIPRPRFVTRKAVIRLGVAAILLAVLAPWAWWSMIRMPGESFRGELPPLTGAQAALSAELKQHVEALAGGIGERNVVRYRNLVAASESIERELAGYGYTVERQEYDVEGKTCVNLAAEIPGADRPDQIVVVGAHYDSVVFCPGANDNGTGVAATLALARALSERPRLRLAARPRGQVQECLDRNQAINVIAADDTGFEIELDEPLTPADVVRLLVENGCSVDEIRPERKGLEEVFLELVAREDAP